jgi:hypothetical protein
MLSRIQLLCGVPQNTVQLRRIMGEGWSYSMGMVGLGDRVAKRQTRAFVDGLDRIVDTQAFGRRLEEIEKGNSLQDDHKPCVQIFLDAWRAREAAED